MNFRETTEKDLEYMADHSVSRGIQKRQPEQLEYMFTLEHESEILGTGGFRLINSTTSWCWLDMSDKSKKHIRTCYRVIKEWIDIFVKTHGLKRLQAYIEPDFEESIRMVIHLGFEYEFTMRNFIEDKDALMYIRII